MGFERKESIRIDERAGGLTGAWLGGLVAMAMLAGLLMLRFRSRAWQTIQI